MLSVTRKAKKIAAKVAKTLDFPIESVTSEPSVELKGSKEAHIFACRAIEEFSSDNVTVTCPSYKIIIRGSDLSVSDFVGSGVFVFGRIRSVEYVGDELC